MEFERGRFEDWEVVCIDSETYAIYRKDYNEEWQNEQGDNLVFDTAEEATQYLRNTFNEGDRMKPTDEALMNYAWQLGYRLSPEDCEEIRRTFRINETIEHAVKDFLSAYEGGNWK